MKRFLYIVVVALTMMIAACGGGGGSAGSNVLNPGTSTGATTTTSATPIVTDFQLGFNKNSLNNSGGDEVILNVIAVDQNNNVARGETVQVSVDSQGVFNASTSVTDGEGKFTGRITSPINKTNRTITVTARMGAIVKTATLNVVGSAITVTPLPAAPLVGENVSYNISLKDSGGVGIPGVALTVSGTAGLSGTLNTDLNGNAIIGGAAPATGGTYTVVVTGSGVSTSRSILVVTASGGGSIPNATTLTLGSLNANVTNIRPNLSSSSLNRAVMTFRMIDSLNQAVPNIRVRFSIVPPGLGAGEAMSTGSTIVYTDAAGTVQSDYISGQRSSPTNGVQVRACYAQTDAALASGACPNFVDAFLTVAGTPLNLSIFSNNVIEPVGTGNILYKKTYAIQVADAAGAPVPGAIVSSSVDITHYGKGFFGGFYTRGSVAPVITDNTASFTLNTFIDGNLNTQIASVPGIYVIADSTPSGTSTANFRIWCANEDKNRNGVLDIGENTDGDNVLEPRASDIVVLAVGSNVTDASGNVTLVAQWGQNVGSWLAFTLKVTTNVGGSEGTNSASFITSYLAADEPNGAFRIPPYGTNGCNVNN
jgi:Bacterial Ig-like domain (group 1)